jgi:hypothetical protein
MWQTITTTYSHTHPPPHTGTNHWIILCYFSLCAVLYLMTAGDVTVLSGVFSIAFLMVLLSFGFANMKVTTWIHMHTHTHMNTCTHTCISSFTCMHTYTNEHMNTCTHTHTHTHTHIYIDLYSFMHTCFCRSCYQWFVHFHIHPITLTYSLTLPSSFY